MNRSQCLSLGLSLLLSTSVYAADWTQWRGPDRSGVHTDATMLAGTLEGMAPEPIWKSEKVLSYAGRLYLIGGQGAVYCLDAATGEEQWKTTVKGAGDISSSFALVDGKLVVLAGRLVALDPETGDLLWEQRKAGGGNGSPAIWKSGAKSYLVAGENRLCCIDPTDGKVLWETQGSGCGTPSISGNTMVTEHGKGLRIYTLSTTEATLVKELEQGGSRGCSGIASDGRAYACGRSEVVCVDTKSGEALWTVKRKGDEFSSPILAGGKLLALGQGGLGMFDAGSGESLGVLKMEFATCTSPALADGMLYVRLKDAVACYSLK